MRLKRIPTAFRRARFMRSVYAEQRAAIPELTARSREAGSEAMRAGQVIAYLGAGYSYERCGKQLGLKPTEVRALALYAVQRFPGFALWERSPALAGLRLLLESQASAREAISPQLPEGWRVVVEAELKQAIVSHPHVGAYAASDNPENIPGFVLYHLALALAGHPLAEGQRA